MKNCWLALSRKKKLNSVVSFIKSISENLETGIIYPDQEISSIYISTEGKFLMDVTLKHHSWHLGYIEDHYYFSIKVESEFASEAFWTTIEIFLTSSLIQHEKSIVSNDPS